MTYHNRHECKFVIGEGTAARVLQRVAPFLVPDPFAALNPRHSYTIASLYLDDEQNTLYRETLGGLARRFKLRVRSYGDDPSLPVFLEVKRRLDRVVQKLRCPIDRAHLPALLAGEIDALPGLSPAKRASLQEFLRLQQQRQAVPKITVRYERQAYVGRDDGDIRVTFDRRLAAMCQPQPVVRMQDERYETLPQRGIVLELKFTDRCPPWMLDAVRDCELQRTSFSKYCRSIDGLHDLGHAEV
jgi:hypothetical protein